MYDWGGGEKEGMRENLHKLQEQSNSDKSSPACKSLATLFILLVVFIFKYHEKELQAIETFGLGDSIDELMNL